jgi:hypothetical protein
MAMHCDELLTAEKERPENGLFLLIISLGSLAQRPRGENGPLFKTGLG